MSLVTTKIFVTSGRTSKEKNISTFKLWFQRNYRVGRTIIKDFPLPNQKLCANATIIKFELLWEGKCVTIMCHAPVLSPTPVCLSCTVIWISYKLEDTKQMPMLGVSFAILLVVLANKKLDWIQLKIFVD